MFSILNLFNKKIKLHKTPHHILIINQKAKFDHKILQDYIQTYNLGKINILCNEDKKNDKNYTVNEGYPNLIILMDDVCRFYLEDPLILYKAEIWFTTSNFSKKVFTDALRHFSECEIKEGK